MRVSSNIYRIIRRCEGVLDRRVLRTVSSTAQALIECGQLSVTALGRALRGRTTARHSIKRVDRLLSNPRLYLQLPSIYRAVAHRIIGRQRPVILIDWSKYGPNQHVLSAAAALSGRAVPLYHEVHGEKRQGNAAVHERFLRQLKSILPQDCRPILVADAGFMVPFCKAIEQMGWHYVVRLSGYVAVRTDPSGAWRQCDELARTATSRVQDLETCELRKTRPITTRLVLGRLPRRTQRSSRSPMSGKHHRKAQRSALRAWVLATNLSTASAAEVVNSYGQRMQIEQWFRDTKSPRFGWALRFTRCSSRLRMEVLLMIASVSTLEVLLAGLTAEQYGVQRGLQASSRTHRRWLSLFTLGVLALKQRLVKTPNSRKPLRLWAMEDT